MKMTVTRDGISLFSAIGHRLASRAELERKRARTALAAVHPQLSTWVLGTLRFNLLVLIWSLLFVHLIWFDSVNLFDLVWSGLVFNSTQISF